LTTISIVAKAASESQSYKGMKQRLKLRFALALLLACPGQLQAQTASRPMLRIFTKTFSPLIYGIGEPFGFSFFK